MLVLHYTGMQTGEAAVARLCDPAAKVSAHYTVDVDGTVYAHVPEDRRAWHAGVSFWAGATDINARSIGIEIVNPGHEFGYRAFPEPQIAALIPLCQAILGRHPIPAARVLGHSDVAPARKEDPGELFPWQRLAKAGIGLWPEVVESSLGPEALARYGYDPNAPQDKVITAFQRHFRPEKLDGQWDGVCAGILSGLLRLIGSGPGA
jgi:N-acetylmuramoyl-L-alanine amidase